MDPPPVNGAENGTPAAAATAKVSQPSPQTWPPEADPSGTQVDAKQVEEIDFLSAAFQSETLIPPTQPPQQGVSLPEQTDSTVVAVDLFSAAFEGESQQALSSEPPQNEPQENVLDVFSAPFQEQPQLPSQNPGEGQLESTLSQQQDFDFLSEAFHQQGHQEESSSQPQSSLEPQQGQNNTNDVDLFSAVSEPTPKPDHVQPSLSTILANNSNTADPNETFQPKPDPLGSGVGVGDGTQAESMTLPAEATPHQGSSKTENPPPTTADSKTGPMSPVLPVEPPLSSRPASLQAQTPDSTAALPVNEPSSEGSVEQTPTALPPLTSSSSSEGGSATSVGGYPTAAHAISDNTFSSTSSNVADEQVEAVAQHPKSAPTTPSNEQAQMEGGDSQLTTTGVLPVPPVQLSPTNVVILNDSYPGQPEGPPPNASGQPTTTQTHSVLLPSSQAEPQSMDPNVSNSVTSSTAEAAGPPNTSGVAETEPTATVDPSALVGKDVGVLGDTETIEGSPETPTAVTTEVPFTPDLAPGNVLNTQPSQRAEQLQIELDAAQTIILKMQQQKSEEDRKASEARRASDALLAEIQASLRAQMGHRAEAEDTARLSLARAERLEQELQKTKEEMEIKAGDLNKDIIASVEELTVVESEFKKVRDERDEQARKETALINRLNAAKKKEAAEANKAERFENQVEGLHNHVTNVQAQLASVSEEKNQLQQQLLELKQFSEKRIQQLETSLSEERKLNDERKRKMKGFVEAKAEEIRSSKEANLSLQTELDQTNRSLNELNQRMKQLHAQWVQSQTRNRELQRDMNKIQKDSEKMNKLGDTLELKLSRSAMATEEHKTKRLTAKNELMSVLRQLEAERDLNNRLRDSIKFTFTPKALSQQQLIQETLQEFESELQKLASRLGRPLPSPPVDHGGGALMGGNSSEEILDPHSTSADSANLANNSQDTGDGTTDPGRQSHSEVTTTRLVDKLESETQRVSQCIMALSTNVERMHSVLAGPGTRNCVSALQSLMAGGGDSSGGGASSEERAAMTLGSRRISGGTRYGQVPGSIA